MSEREAILAKLLDAARAASDVVMCVYQDEDVGAELKGPNDPVTRADREANAVLVERLSRAFPGVPIVAEESDPSSFHDFGRSRAALFVDPVDGTRDFIAKNGEFAVMIGFAEEGRATAGVIASPALSAPGSSERGLVYAGAEGLGAFRVHEGGARTPIHVSDQRDLRACRCAVSRFHRATAVDQRLALLELKELVTVGSAGLKAVRVATGELEVYAHPSGRPVKLWDACAPDALVRAAGGILTDALGRPFDYRGDLAQGVGTLAANPVLHAEAARRLVAFEERP